jgi:integration host factor subunit alpha
MIGQSGGAVTRAVLRDAVYRCCTSLSREQASLLLDATIEEICEALVCGESFKLSAFGTFNVRSKRERTGRNPKTGAEAPITARRSLIFKASEVLRARVNGEIFANAKD